jgi:tRNA-specific 2-thiouridylase
LARIAVALSGGVDSSTAALKLLQEGHQVVGLTMRLGWGPGGAGRAAGAAARQLGIEHRIIEVKDQFTQRVLEPVVRAYENGLTPNPCALCNPGIKFPLLWQAAKEERCDSLATGHYARLLEVKGRRVLAQAHAVNKSQAYFLARLQPRILKRLRFPLGGMTKEEVRQMAKAEGLDSADRPDSQEVCFLPPGGWDELMERFGAIRPGPLEDIEGRELGRHQGLHRFTVGQRRGLGVALGRKAYVAGLDPKRAAVRIGPASALVSAGLKAAEPLWHLPPEDYEELKVRIRYAHPGVGCRVAQSGGQLLVEFDRPQKAVAPGQLAVFYANDLVIGSAWITRRVE